MHRNGGFSTQRSALRQKPVSSRSLRSTPSPRLVSVRTQAGFNPIEFIRSMFDFESWAPKSSRIWRLNKYTPPSIAEEPRAEVDDAVDDLEEQIRRATEKAKRDAEKAPKTPVRAATVAAIYPVPKGSPVFSSSDDGSLASALSRRIAELAAASALENGEEEEEEGAEGVVALVMEGEEAIVVVEPLEGDELRTLIYDKYKKSLDVSIVRRDIPGKSFVSLNILWNHMEQRSFKMTEDQYNEKLESVAMMINILNQTEKVRNFLLEPAKSKNGMPARPVVGTAVSVRFEGLSKEVVEEWFGAGYF